MTEPAGPTPPQGPQPPQRPASSYAMNASVGALVANVTNVVTWIAWNIVGTLYDQPIPSQVHESGNFIIQAVVGAAIMVLYTLLMNQQWFRFQRSAGLLVLPMLLALGLGCACPTHQPAPRDAFYAAVAGITVPLVGLDAWLYSSDASKRPEVRAQVEDAIREVRARIDMLQVAADSGTLTDEMLRQVQQFCDERVESAQAKVGAVQGGQ